jgi:hypothetical protein
MGCHREVPALFAGPKDLNSLRNSVFSASLRYLFSSLQLLLPSR